MEEKKNTKPVKKSETPKAPKKPVYGVVDAYALNCRKQPDLNADLDDFGPIKQGDEVEILETKNGWHKIATKNGSCYVKAEFIKLA